jgi:TP901 family phage tail tape measure protein
MAEAEIGALRVTLAMDAGEFRRGSKQIQSELSGLGGRIADIGAKIDRASIFVNTGILAAQRFANVSRAILSASSDFEKGMTNVGTLIDSAAESLAQMSDEVIGVGRRTPVALSELTGALYDIRSAGIGAGEAMGVLENSAKLAVAGLGTTKEAADLVTSSINAFGLKGEAAGAVYDAIFKTVKAGKTTISQLAQGFGAVAGTVATAGIALDDYLASIAALTTTGLPAAQAHTQIRAAIAGLTRETREAKALLDALGAGSFKQLVEQSGGLVTAFERIVNATGGNDAQLIKLLGSVEAYNAVVGLAGKQNGVYLATLKDMRQGADALGAAFEKQNATVAAATQRLQNNVGALGIALGTALAPAIRELADLTEAITGAFKSLSPQMQETVAKLAAFAAVLAPAAVAAGFFANALASLVPVFAAVGAAAAGLIAAGGPIAAFVVSASAAVTAWNIFKEDIIGIWDTVGDLIASKIADIVARLTRFADAVQVAFGQLASFEFSAAFKTLDDAVTRTRAWETAIERLGGTATRVAGEIMPAAASAFRDGYVAPMSEGIDALTRLIEERHNEALRSAARIIEDIQSPMDALIEKQWRIKEAFDAGGLSAAQQALAMQNAALVASNAYASMAGSIAQDLGKVFENNKAVAIAQALINTFQAITNAWANVPWPVNIAAAAAAAAAGFAQVANIRRTTKNGGGGGSGAAGGGSAGASSAAQSQAPQKLIVQGISPGALFTGDAVKTLANQLLQYQRDGGEVVLQ